MSDFQEVFCIIEKLFHSNSLPIDQGQLSQFVELIINSNKSFVDLYEWIRDHLKIKIISAYQLIKSLLSDKVYKLIAGRKLYILLLYFEIVIQLGFQRSIYETQRKKISSILQSLDFGKDILTLIKKCLKDTYEEQYSFQQICEIRRNIIKTISRQLLKIIDIDDSQHYDVWFIKHEEENKNYKISIFLSTDGSQSKKETAINTIFSEKEEQQIQLPHRKMKISSFTPKMIFLGISIQLLMAHQQSLIQLFKCLRCLCANLIDILHVQFFTNGLVTQSQKNQIQENLYIEMSNSEGDLHYFIQYLLKESKKGTNYINLLQHSEKDYYKRVYKTIQNKYPLSQITKKKSMKIKDERIEQFINQQTLQQCKAQKRFKQSAQQMKRQKKIDEQFPSSHLKIFELYSLNLIYRKIIVFFHDQFNKQEVSFRDNNHDCSSDLVSNQCHSQLNILELFKINNIKEFLSQKLKKTQKMFILQLQQLENNFENNQMLNFPSLAMIKIKKILQRYSNDHLQANNSILAFGKRCSSLIYGIQQIQDISQILMNLSTSSIQNDLLQSSQQDLYINWQVKMRTLSKKVKHDLYLKSKSVNIDEVISNQIEEYYHNYLPPSQNATIQSLQWIKAMRFKQLSTIFVTIKSQIDFVRYILQKGEISSINLEQLSVLTSKLSEKKFISEQISNRYKLNIRQLSKRLLKCNQKISFINVSQIYNYGLYDQHIPFSQNFDKKKKYQQKQILNNNDSSYQQNQSEQSLKNIQLCPNTIRIPPYKQNHNRRQQDVDMQSTHQVEQNLQYVNQSYESNFYDEQKKTYDNILKENGGIKNA